MRYANYTYDELLNIAERENNELAIHIADSAEDELREELEKEFDDTLKVEDGLMSSVHESVEYTKYLLTEADWVKHDDDPVWWVSRFNRDTTVSHNHIGITGLGGGLYEVSVEVGPYGEDVREKRVSGLKNAKNEAVNMAIEAAGERMLME